MSDKRSDEMTRQATDVAEAIATANQLGNGQFSTHVDANNAVVSERK